MSATSRPRPVLTSDLVGGAVHALVLILPFLGFANVATKLSGLTEAIIAVALGAGTILLHVAPGLYAQLFTTPVSDPRNAAGEKLYTAAQLGVGTVALPPTALASAGTATDGEPAGPDMVAALTEPVAA